MWLVLKMIAFAAARSGVLCVIAWLSFVTPAGSYPQYQTFVEKHSGRTVNCSMCHVNDNGPVGDGGGQIGSLSAAEMTRLNQARAAMQPGQNVDSPILNKFGNQIIKKLGRANFLQTVSDPGQLGIALGDRDDLDGDGIPDSREFLDGTDPLNKFHGDPWLMLKNNMLRYKVHLLLAAVSIGLAVYGLKEIYSGFVLAKAEVERDGLNEKDQAENACQHGKKEENP